jgi:L-amino acid N-acyltransferase YncA
VALVSTPITDAAPRVVIRGAGPNDWDRVAALLAASSLPLDGAREAPRQLRIAERRGTLVGCAAVERYGDAGLLRSIAVAESERGKGTGAALVGRCLEDARAAGSGPRAADDVAERYFPRFGFEVIDRDAVPEGVRASAEFRGACPASATVMRLVSSTGVAKVTVRPARPGDAPAIAAIYNAGIRGRMATFETAERTADDIAAWFTRPASRFVAERDGHVVGWVAASPYRARACYAGVAEFSVYVDPAVQGQRVGDALMSAFIPALERRGILEGAVPNLP